MVRSKNKIITALDIGTSKIVAFMASGGYNANNVKVIAKAAHPANGFKSGIVTDLKQAENSILKTIKEIERIASERIDKIVVSVTNNNIYSSIVKSKIISGSSNSINQKDVTKVISSGIDKFNGENQDLIHYFPLEYSLDGHFGIKNPILMYGKELSCHLHLVSAQTGVILNLANCIARCQLDIEDFILAPYASAVSCLNDLEMSQGALVIDIGSTITSFSIFDDNNFIFTDAISLGGWHITNDIAKCFSLNFDQAERIKILHGNVVATSLDEHKTFELNHSNESDYYFNEINVMKSKELSEVIKPRAEEIFEHIIKKLQAKNIWQYRPKRIILTGGASQLPGMKDLASYMIGAQARIASPRYISGLSEEYQSPAFSTVTGMIKIMNDNIIKSDILNQSENKKSFFAKILDWF